MKRKKLNKKKIIGKFIKARKSKLIARIKKNQHE